MTMMIILTEAEAEQVRGPSSVDPGAALEPVPTPDGTRWMLPLAVLDDPAHADYKAFLGTLPQEDVQPAEIELEDEPPPDDDPPDDEPSPEGEKKPYRRFGRR